MSAYKNLEIYQSAFNLAIKIYRLNVTLSVSALLNQGNRLRWVSLRVKDVIAEAYTGVKHEKDILRNLILAESACDDVINLLKKIRSNNENLKQLPDLIKNYKGLKRKIGSYIQKIQEDKNAYVIPFPDSLVMEVA
jgi:four helix bundle protein